MSAMNSIMESLEWEWQKPLEGIQKGRIRRYELNEYYLNK